MTSCSGYTSFRKKKKNQFLAYFLDKVLQLIADLWEKGVWNFEAKSGTSASCPLFLRFVRQSTVRNRRLKKLPVPVLKGKRSQKLAPVLVIISGNSLVFSRNNITSTGLAFF